MKNNNIYEINTRVWLHRFSNSNKKIKIDEVPIDYWKNLAELGIDYIWLMGIWKTNESVVPEYCFTPDLVKEYKKALPNYKDTDVIGSPYSIDSYEINPDLGNKTNLINLKSILNSLGLKLILDFIPNHFSVHSSLINTNPELFLPGNEECIKRDSHTFFRTNSTENKIFAHGRDPFFPAWGDTIQVNYFSNSARSYMINAISDLTNVCDGIRCDMAMLCLNNVFDNVWSKTLTSGNFKKPTKEFWEECISEIKSIDKEFIFIGEAYWDLEWELQRLGFDYTYDKQTLDRLKLGHIEEIKNHLTADKQYQQKSIRFLENHDEDRAILAFGTEKSKAAAVIINTISGMKLFYDGQFEGKRSKLPVQLGKESIEKVNDCIYDHYIKLLELTKEDIFKIGEWELLEPIASWETNNSYHNFLAWKFTMGDRNRVVVINYSREVSQCRIKLDLNDYPDKFKLKDLLNNKSYYRQTNEVEDFGLYIELGPYKSHIFSY